MKQIEDFGVTDYLTWIAICGVATFAIDYNWKRRWLYYYASKMNGPISFPFIGTLYIATIAVTGGKTAVLDAMHNLATKYGHPFRYWIGPKFFVAVSKPEHIELVAKKCLEKGQQYDHLRRALGKAIISSSLETWKGHRRLINQTFNQTTLNSYMDVFIDHSNALVDRLRTSCLNGQIDLYPEFCKTSFGIVCDTAMGIDHRTIIKKQDRFMEYVDIMLTLLGERFYKPLHQLDILWNLFGPGKLFHHVQTTLLNYVKEIVEKKKQDESNSDVYEISNKKDFLSFLIRMSKELNWEDQELIDETFGMIVAGYHTTATTECFLMLMLGLHQDVQEKVYQEMQSIFGDSDRDATVEDLNKMEYFNNVCKETMRLFPIGPLLLRQTDENINLDGTIVPKGANLLIHVHHIHRDPSIWPNPSKFDPDRFLPEEVQKRPRFSYVPFSVPPRNCIGNKFAEMSMKVTLSNIVRKFKVYSTQYDSIDSIKLEFNITLAATNGYRVSLVPR